MTVFACIISFILGWLAYKAADMYDRKREKEMEELEKENTELRDKYLQATDNGTSCAHLKNLEKGKR